MTRNRPPPGLQAAKNGPGRSLPTGVTTGETLGATDETIGRRFAKPERLLLLIAAAGLWLGPGPAVGGDDLVRQQRVDQAVVRALEYLARAQEPSGAWRIERIGESTAATSLAIMAFLAAGHVPAEGPYADNLDRGIRWILDHQQPNGMLVHRKSHGPMYSHGISTLMLAEVVGVVEPSLAGRCRRALERAIRLILQAQQIRKSSNHAGGWRYQATSRDSDLSVTGWQLLALRAAKDIGCDVPADAIDRAIAYVKRCSTRGDRGFGYQPGGGTTPTRSGTGILALEVCGAHRCREVLGAAEYLLERPLQLNDHYFFYGVYYCTVGMFKVGGHYWEQTRDRVGELLLSSQRPDGSWLSPRNERSHGPIYATSMAVLALTVEYRYLPIYQR